MTEATLLKVLMCICGHMKPIETAKLCMETYANCAVVYNGEILTITEFDIKCNYVKDQNKCYNK